MNLLRFRRAFTGCSHRSVTRVSRILDPASTLPAYPHVDALKQPQSDCLCTRFLRICTRSYGYEPFRQGFGRRASGGSIVFEQPAAKES